MLQIRWRRWLTDRYLERWIGGRVYYRMQLTDRGTDNPDQRIAEDLALFVDRTLSLTLGLLSAVVTLASFVAILWSLSGTLELALAGTPVSIPGYMVWVALLYAIVGTWLTHRVGRPLIELNFNQQRFEANFRFSLVRFRENTESIAIYGGEAGEMRGLSRRFADVVGNWWEIMRRQKKLALAALRLRPDRDHLSVRRGGAPLFLGRDPAGRPDADRIGLRPGPGRALVVRLGLRAAGGVEGDGGSPDRLPGRHRACPRRGRGRRRRRAPRSPAPPWRRRP